MIDSVKLFTIRSD